MRMENPVASTDGFELQECDHFDIGAIPDTAGAVPVVIKSLVLPTSAGTGEDRETKRAISAATSRYREIGAPPGSGGSWFTG